MIDTLRRRYHRPRSPMFYLDLLRHRVQALFRSPTVVGFVLRRVLAGCTT